jgi:membrane dipeptidase
MFFITKQEFFLIGMGGKKVYNGYKAFRYLEPGFDYKEFRLTEHPRVEPYYIPLSNVDEERFQELMEKTVLVDLHEHPVL